MVRECEMCGGRYELRHRAIDELRQVPRICSDACLVNVISAPAPTGKRPYTEITGTGVVYRSSYERDFGDWLNLKGIKFQYEPQPPLTIGCGKLYLPDFYLPDSGWLVEIKGRWVGEGWRKFEKAESEHAILLLTSSTMKIIRRGLRQESTLRMKHEMEVI